MFEFDHFFTFVDPSFKDSYLNKGELKAGLKTEHKGQGTTAMFSFFEKVYLEWIWLSDIEDAKGQKTRADLRANWKESGWSPFGIGLRGILSKNEQKDYYCYNPPYAPEKSLWIHSSSLDNPSIPMIFVQEMSPEDKYENWWPKNRLKKYPDRDSCYYGYRALEKIILSGPKLIDLPVEVDKFEVKSGESFDVTVKINGLDPVDLDLDHFSFG